MTIQLIFKEADVKGIMPISDNIYGEYMASAMMEAQEIYLRQIIGNKQLDALKAAQTAGTPTTQQTALIEQAKLYLCYQTVVNLIPKVSLKISNFGVHTDSDTNITAAQKEVWDTACAGYQANADAFLRLFQEWVCEHIADYPLIGQCKNNLRSFTNTDGIWTGGYIGR